MHFRRAFMAIIGAWILAACGLSPAASQLPTAPEPTRAVQAPSDTIRIGLGFALTGDESVIDVPTINGALLAAKEINAKGGVLGQQIELIIHDSQYKLDVTARIAKQFAEQDRVVSVIGFSDTDSVLTAGPIFQQAGLPFITPAATSPKLPNQVGDKMFLACFGDNVQAAAAAEFGLRTFGKRAYLLVDDGVEYTNLLGGYFKAGFTALGGTIVLEDQFEDKAFDFAPQIAKLKALPSQPDFYYIAAMPYNIGPIVQQFRAAGLHGPIVGGDGYDDPSWVAAAGPAAENVFFTTHALMDGGDGTPAIKQFIAAYQSEYGRAPESAFTALGYDTMHLLAAAITRAGSTEARTIQQAIEATKDFPGITGTISFSTNNRVPQKGVTIIAIKNGKYALGAQIVPQQVPAP